MNELLWLRGLHEFKHVPDAMLPLHTWPELIGADDEMFDEWREGILAKRRMEPPRSERPDFWGVPALSHDDWTWFTEWVNERLPARLPPNADDLARQWLRTHAVDRTLFDLTQWRRLLSETWLTEIGDALIWIALIGEERKAFRVDAGDCVDVDGDVVELEADALVHLAHPMDLNVRLRVAWAQHLAEHQITSLFDQLDTQNLRDEPDLDGIFGTEARDWAMDAWGHNFVDTRQGYYEFWRDFGTRGRAVAEVRDAKIFGLQFFDAHGQEVELDRLDPVVRSQTVADFEYAFARWKTR